MEWFKLIMGLGGAILAARTMDRASEERNWILFLNGVVVALFALYLIK